MALVQPKQPATRPWIDSANLASNSRKVEKAVERRARQEAAHEIRRRPRKRITKNQPIWTIKWQVIS